VSVTKVKSRTGVSEPSRSGPPASACAAMVGMTARSDWRGPYVLKGRSVATGTSKDRQ
jgi:hypothetical protein